MQTPLKAARERAKVTTYEVSRGVGMAQSHYSRVENGEAGASPEVAARLASFFGHAVTEMQILYPERYASEPSPMGMEA